MNFMEIVVQTRKGVVFISSITYPAIWRCGVSSGGCGVSCGDAASPARMRRLLRGCGVSCGRCGVSCGRCGVSCGGCASIKEMIHLQWERTASPNFGICDTIRFYCSVQLNIIHWKLIGLVMVVHWHIFQLKILINGL